MKRLTAILISILLVCLLLAGCTPKNTDPTESGTAPGLTDPDYRPSPEGSVAPDETKGQEPGTEEAQPTDPAETQPTETEEPSGSELPDDSDEDLTVPEPSQPGEVLASEDEDEEIEDEFVIEIGENDVIGGN